MENVYGVVTYSKNRGASGYFIRLHDTWKTKSRGRVHIDVGCTSEKYKANSDVLHQTHLMQDKEHAPDFIDFIKKTREKKRTIEKKASKITSA